MNPCRFLRKAFRLLGSGCATVLVAIGALSTPLAEADQTVVQLAADEAWQPFIDEDLPEGGLITDLVVRALEQAGRDAEVTFLPWSRVLEATAAGRFDAIAGAYHSEKRAGSFIYSEQFLRFRVSLIGRRDFPLTQYESLTELEGHEVGIIRDAAYPQSLFDSGLTLHRSSTREGLVRMLQQGRIDLMADTKELFRHHALNAGLNPDDFVVLSPPLRDQELFVIAPRSEANSQALMDDFNRGLKALEESGDYLEIRRRYGF